jgi:serine protease Do
VKTVIAQLKDKGSVTRGWIGVQIQQVTRDIADSLGLKTAAGALVAEPQTDSPAAKAGIKSGDVITKVDGEAIKDSRTLARRISTMSPGTSVKLTLVREGKEQVVTLTLGELPAERVARADLNNSDNDAAGPGVPKLGLSLAPASALGGADSAGVVVTSVDPDGPAAEHGFKTGDVILDVGGTKVQTPSDVRKMLTEAKSSGKRTILMRVKSDQGTRFVALPVGSA